MGRGVVRPWLAAPLDVAGGLPPRAFQLSAHLWMLIRVGCRTSRVTAGTFWYCWRYDPLASASGCRERTLRGYRHGVAGMARLDLSRMNAWLR